MLIIKFLKVAFVYFSFFNKKFQIFVNSYINNFVKMIKFLNNNFF